MRLFLRICPGILFFCLIAVALEPRALAYVDPGSGLLLVQSIGAVMAAGAFWFRRQLRNLVSRFRSSGQKAER